MPSPTWHHDGILRRIYEVPPGASFTTDGNGYRLYDGGPSPAAVLSVDVKKDLWSRWIDWHALHDWALLAFSRSGGSLRPTGEYAPADFSLLTASGWRIVLADYPHETIFYGNLFPEGSDSLFDNARLTEVGIVPRLQGSANLLTYNYATSGNAYSLEQIAGAVWQKALEGLTAEQMMRVMLAALAGKTAGVGTASESYLAQDGLTPRIVAGFDTSSNRTSVTLDGGA
jgi:hypothetical protein